MAENKPTDISRLKQLFSAGELAMEAEEWPRAIKRFEKQIHTLVRSSAFNEREVLLELNELFDIIFKTGLAGSFTAQMPEQTYLLLGRHLLTVSGDLQNEARKIIHLYLELFRQPAFLKQIKQTQPWEELILQLIEKSNFTIAPLLRQRFQLYADKTIFALISGENVVRYSFATVRERILQYARGLLALGGSVPQGRPTVAFFMENSLEMALLDLACLSSGLVNVMIPANSVGHQVAFILNQTGAKILLISGHKQLEIVNQVRRELRHVDQIVMIKEQPTEERILSQTQLIQMGMNISDDQVVARQESFTTRDLATIMYTSGTTGEPKGIMFSHLNIIYKRFCRAMALPEIGPQDRFLSYLPLFHTFGRYLEMMGAVFWSAEYYFMENPAIDTLVRNMQLVRPTIFISIPKKWMQLYEYIARRVDVELDDERLILKTLKEVTGGQLRWGLSAAGYLDPAIFRFFQRNGVELLSGFGMTEATGGITMTEPGNYVENTLGKPLPGIEVKLAKDGELLIRGPYVMIGYYGHREQPFVDGWFPTGDIMRRLPNGYFEIIDRKKEIYKNIRGETIAPQRIENFFYDSEFVKQVFLVGDNRPFNTVLIYPNFEGADNPLRQMNAEELHDFFSSLVVTVNNFLAPFERIVDFRIVDRPFSAEHGELTPKGTFKRRVIEKNFAHLIEAMYEQSFIDFKWQGLTLQIPNWFLREKSYLVKDIQLDENGMIVPEYGRVLPLQRIDQDLLQIGNYVYRFTRPFIDLQIVFSNPLYWLGNRAIIEFTGEEIFHWYRLDNFSESLQIVRYYHPIDLTAREQEEFLHLNTLKEVSLKGVHLALLHIQSEDEAAIEKGIAYLKIILDDPQQSLYALLRQIIGYPRYVWSVSALQQMFRLGLSLFKGWAFQDYLARYVDFNFRFLTPDFIAEVADKLEVDVEVLQGIHSLIKNEINKMQGGMAIRQTGIAPLLHLLGQIGVLHPMYYKQIRQCIVRYQLRKDIPGLAELASEVRIKLLEGFRRWIGENQKISIDVETGEEYRWSDVVIFEEDIPAEDKAFLLKAITERPIIREALFLLGDGILAGLYDIPPGGVWISTLFHEPGHSVYRVSVQTRFQGGADFVINLERDQPTETIREEMNWLIHAGAAARGIRLVEEFGGFWREFNLWTEEYIPGDSLQVYISKLMRRNNQDSRQRLKVLWPHFVWSGISAHISFWRRTGYQLEIEDKSAANIMIPAHDYLTGVRIFSIRNRKKSAGLLALIADFYRQFVETQIAAYPFLKDEKLWHYIFSGILDAEGESKALEQLRALLNEQAEQLQEQGFLKALKTFLRQVEKDGFIPRNLYFAIQRFRRWINLNPRADFSAQLFTLNELYETYQLSKFEKRYPEIRIRFYLETVFKDSIPEMRKKLKNIIRRAAQKAIPHEERLKLFSELRNQFDLNEKEEFFLSRLGYPHLQPEDSAGWLSASPSGVQQSDVVVTMEDYDGRRFHVRKPMSPKEIARLHNIFLEANLPVVFKPEHRFLIAVSERGYVIGGLFYSMLNEETAHMEKIVVTAKYRRKGISEGLMVEFFNRMRDAGFKYVTTGFFRPEYFYRFGFKIERKYAGLVKDLTEGN
ncbi:GNAT family N-acetyltransferase [Caldithrix abyssi]